MPQISNGSNTAGRLPQPGVAGKRRIGPSLVTGFGAAAFVGVLYEISSVAGVLDTLP